MGELLTQILLIAILVVQLAAHRRSLFHPTRLRIYRYRRRARMRRIARRRI